MVLGKVSMEGRINVQTQLCVAVMGVASETIEHTVTDLGTCSITTTSTKTHIVTITLLGFACHKNTQQL